MFSLRFHLRKSRINYRTRLKEDCNLAQVIHFPVKSNNEGPTLGCLGGGKYIILFSWYLEHAIWMISLKEMINSHSIVLDVINRNKGSARQRREVHLSSADTAIKGSFTLAVSKSMLANTRVMRFYLYLKECIHIK